MSSSKALGSAAIAAALVLAGCTSTAAPPQTGLPPQDDCAAAALQSRIGQPVTGQTVTDVRVGGLPLEGVEMVRVIAPGQAVTMDFHANRLNLETDGAGNLVRAYCA